MLFGEMRKFWYKGRRVYVYDVASAWLAKMGRSEDLGITVFRKDGILIALNVELIDFFASEMQLDEVDMYAEVLCHELAHIIGFLEEDNISEEFADRIAVEFLADLGINSVICIGGVE